VLDLVGIRSILEGGRVLFGERKGLLLDRRHRIAGLRACFWPETAWQSKRWPMHPNLAFRQAAGRESVSESLSGDQGIALRIDCVVRMSRFNV
jgi:hypothetical protein